MKFKIGQKVELSQDVWEKEDQPTGTIVGAFDLNTNVFDSEPHLEVSVRHRHLTPYGYDVLWDHNNSSNPWSEVELEAAE